MTAFAHLWLVSFLQYCYNLCYGGLGQDVGSLPIILMVRRVRPLGALAGDT